MSLQWADICRCVNWLKTLKKARKWTLSSGSFFLPFWVDMSWISGVRQVLHQMLDRCNEWSPIVSENAPLPEKDSETWAMCSLTVRRPSQTFRRVWAESLRGNNGWTSGRQPDVSFSHSSSCFSTAAAVDQVPCSWALLQDRFVFFLFSHLAERSGAAALCWWPFTSELKTKKVRRETTFHES